MNYSNQFLQRNMLGALRSDLVEGFLMKRFFVFSSIFSFFACSSYAFGQQNYKIQHTLPLDLTGDEYLEILEKRNIQNSFQLKTAQQDEIEKILELGARNLQWLEHLNQNRQTPLFISSPENRRVYPVESPSIYNKKTVIKDYEDLIEKLPSAMKSVLIYGKNFTDELPVEEDTYLYYALNLDYLYQSAARWSLMQEYIPYLRQVRKEDVRGYLTLSKIENLEENLERFYDISSDTQSLIHTALLRVCYNTEANDAKCANAFSKSLSQNAGNALPFYAKYIDKSIQNYNERFIIPAYAARKDVEWTINSNIAKIPFLEVDEKYKPLLHHIEMEWQWNDWKLVLDYRHSGVDIPKLIFEAGTVPHVNTLGGNEIVMDANTPLDEWDVQWTIRHEFGHVLGFPDCYMEFYDDSIGAIVNYQLDVTNLMCSRKGKLQEKHFNEMKKHYYNLSF